MKEYIVTEHPCFPYEDPKPQELIRCKDCIHWDGKYHYCEVIDDCRDWNADDYCSVAERKEE